MIRCRQVEALVQLMMMVTASLTCFHRIIKYSFTSLPSILHRKPRPLDLQSTFARASKYYDRYLRQAWRKLMLLLVAKYGFQKHAYMNKCVENLNRDNFQFVKKETLAFLSLIVNL